MLRGVPVNDEPRDVHGSNNPAVSAEHVEQQQSAGSTYKERREERQYNQDLETELLNFEKG